MPTYYYESYSRERAYQGKQLGNGFLFSFICQQLESFYSRQFLECIEIIEFSSRLMFQHLNEMRAEHQSNKKRS